jgi:TPR repeat protein
LAAARQSLAVAETYDGRYIEAQALQKLDRHAEAVEAFSRIVAQYNSTREVFTGRAYSYAQLARWAEAVRDLRIAYEDFLSPWAFQLLVRLSAGNSGWNLRTRDTEAGELCREAALRGLPIAMTCLGGLHYFGTGGVAKDAALARQWFARAAAAGEPQAMMDLAQMCATGQGGSVDREQAIEMWVKAARRDHPQAQGKLDSELGIWERVRYVHWPEIEQHARGWLRWAVVLLQFVFSRS